MAINGAKANEYDLQQAWNTACEEFVKTTGKELKVKNESTPEQVLEQLRADQEQTEAKAAKHRVAKNALSRTLELVDCLGNIAAQGASLVFGPAALVGNALSFLIAAGAKYRHVYDVLTELSTKISGFLERFKVYFRMIDVDIALRIVLNKLLVCFVSICGLLIKTFKKKKLKIFAEVLAFGGNEEVNEKLEEFNALVEEERELRATLGYEVGKKIEQTVNDTHEGLQALTSNVQELAEQEKRKEANSARSKQLESVKEALNKPADVYLTYAVYKDKMVKGTGEWLFKHQTYSNWITTTPSTTSILCFSGEEGYGKSFLMSNVVQDLRRRFPQGESHDHRTSIAYYYFQRHLKGSEIESNGLSLSSALKSLAWQIANVDTVYLKALYAVHARAKDTELSDLWKLLFGAAFRSDATFYLLLDGIDQMEVEHIETLAHILQDALQTSQDIKERGPLCLRILVSGKNQCINKLKADIDVSTIDLVTNNKDDIESFIRERIRKISILDGATPEDQKRRDDVFAALTKTETGDFIGVDLLLKQIAEKRRYAEMLDVLKQFQGEDRLDTIARSIKGLNKTLPQQDILDLNELLTWIISCKREMTLAELDTVLRMKNGEDEYSLQPLSESITERYSKLLRLNGVVDAQTNKMPLNTTVKIISETIQEYFLQVNAKNEEEDVSTNNQAGNRGDVSESEVRIVRRFLESVCDDELFRKFQFEEFFLAKRNNSTAVIHFNPEMSHLKIITACMEGLLSDDVKWNPLMGYIREHFDQHLAAVDLSLAQPSDKKAIGGKILKCFSEEKIIEKWWVADRIEVLRVEWVVQSSKVDVVLNWFKDSAVVKGLDMEGKQWTKDLTSNSRPEADLLEHIAKFVAKKWLQWSIGTLSPAFLFLHSFTSKIESRLKLDKGNWEPVNVMEDVKIEQISSVLRWAQEKLALSELGYEETRNLGRTYRECGHYHEAIEIFKKAATLAEDNALCRWGLATTYGRLENWPMAIETVQGVIKSIEAGEVKEHQPLTWLDQLLRELAQYTKNSGDNKGTIEIYQNILETQPRDYLTPMEYLTFLTEGSHVELLVDFIERMKRLVHDEQVFDRWSMFYYVFARYQPCHQTLISCGNLIANLQAISDGYKASIKVAKSKVEAAKKSKDPTLEDATSRYYSLIYYFGIFLQQTQHVPDSTHLAVTKWEQIVAHYAYLDGRVDEEHVVLLARSSLPFAYLELAIRSDPDSDVAKECISKLRGLFESGKEDVVYNYLDAKQAMARYYSQIGKLQEAKDLLRNEIKTNLELLSDEDPENDWQGYQGLAECLMVAGEREHATAAWSLITPNLVDGELPDLPDPTVSEDTKDLAQNGSNSTHDHESAETQQTLISNKEADDVRTEGSVEVANTDKTAATNEASEKVPLKGPMYNCCDGDCDTDLDYAKGFYFCLDCFDIQWCEDCMKKVKEGNPPRWVCNKDHEMFWVLKYDPENLRRIGKGNVEVDGQIVNVNEWKNMIRKLWDIETVEVAQVESKANGD